jgi:hypothetical protein
LLRETINEVIEAFEHLVEVMEDSGTDASIVEIVEDAKSAFLEMHDEDDGKDDDDEFEDD